MNYLECIHLNMNMNINTALSVKRGAQPDIRRCTFSGNIEITYDAR